MQIADMKMERTAVISDDQQYRYKLTRSWGPETPYVLWVMLNPSTADADVDDPTIRRCIGFTQGWGFESLVVVNLFAYRATNPDALLRASDPIGPTNDQHIITAAKSASLTICAWGAHKLASTRAFHVKKMLSYPVCLGRTKEGYPRHPLYVPAEQKVQVY